MTSCAADLLQAGWELAKANGIEKTEGAVLNYNEDKVTMCSLGFMWLGLHPEKLPQLMEHDVQLLQDDVENEVYAACPELKQEVEFDNTNHYGYLLSLVIELNDGDYFVYALSKEERARLSEQNFVGDPDDWEDPNEMGNIGVPYNIPQIIEVLRNQQYT